MDTPSPIASCQYHDQNQRQAELVLTESELIFLSHPYRDVFPLNALRSMGVVSGMNIPLVAALVFGLVLSLGCAAIFGNTIFLQTPDASAFMKTVPIGMLVIGLFLLYLLLRLRLRFTRIVVQSDAGTRLYEVAARNPALDDFVGKVAQALKARAK